MANTKDYQDAIVEATRVDDDIKLVEAILEYFSAVENVTFLPLKRIKSFFVAARSTDSEAWKDLSDKEALAVENILAWTGHSPNTIAVVLRTYERSTPELRQAQQDGRLSRYPAESISRLYKGTLKDLQPRLIEMYLRYGITNEDLRKLVQELQHTIGQGEREEILARYTPTPIGPSVESRRAESSTGEPTGEDETIFLLSETRVGDLRQLSKDELWNLMRTTETTMQHAIPLLEKSLEQIKQELKRRL